MIRIFVFWVLVALGINLFAGLIAFALATDQVATNARIMPVDAIVVLTGGSGERLQYAGKLYQQKTASKLLVSGVNPQVSEQDLLKLLGLSQLDLRCCVDVDAQAKNTTENAYQIALWAKKNHHKKLIVVTSTYHMPRTQFLLRAVLPDMQLIFVPARSIGAAKQHVFRRTFVEYGKFLVVLFTKQSAKQVS